MDNLNMDSLDLPEIKGLDNDLPPLPAAKTETAAEAKPEPEAEYDTGDDYEFDPSAVPMLSEMDGSEAPAAALKSAADTGIDGDWKRKSAPTSAPGFAGINDTDPDADSAVSLSKSTTASGASAAQPGERPMSARERRMAEPFDMPGAYTPASGGMASQTSSFNGAYQPTSTVKQRRDEALNQMYAARQEHYDKGRKKAQTVGYVVIALNVFSALSALTRGYGSGMNKFIDVGMAAAMIFMCVMFMRGSYQYRAILGRFAVIDFIWGLIGMVQIKPAIDAANAALTLLGQWSGMSEAEIQASLLDPAPYILMALIKVIGYGAMVYFYVFDGEIADYAND